MRWHYRLRVEKEKFSYGGTRFGGGKHRQALWAARGVARGKFRGRTRQAGGHCRREWRGEIDAVAHPGGRTAAQSRTGRGQWRAGLLPANGGAERRADGGTTSGSFPGCVSRIQLATGGRS